MGTKLWGYAKGFLFGFTMTLFGVLSVYLIVMGSFCLAGGNTACEAMPALLRGSALLAAVLLLFFFFRFVCRLLSAWDEKRISRFCLGCFVLMAVLQCAFLYAAKAGIRYDALKVFDEALALFSQEGIGEQDLGGYFARYSNNYAMTIMTHWLIKLLRGIGVIAGDFSNALPVMQYINLFFLDLALAGGAAFVKRFAGVKSAAVFALYALLNPLSYVWLPFYYTNICAMPFVIWGAYLLLCGCPDKGTERKGAAGRDIACMAVSGVLFAFGFYIRATVAIGLIAGALTLFYRGVGSKWRRIAVFLLSAALTAVLYGRVEDHYLAFDERESEFPMTHWIAMGLSDTGSFSPADEAYTMSFATKAEKSEAAKALIRERARGLGFGGICRLYAKKLSDTFADGTGGYHSELSISRHYGTLWQYVYGVHRDPLLTVTQIVYLLSLVSGVGVAWLLFQKKLDAAWFFVPLLLLGSWLFQMLWEAGTIYSIGTMYVNGCMVAGFLPYISEKETAKPLSAAGLLAGTLGTLVLLWRLSVTEYTEVTMSVDQFLYEADTYIALSKGMELSQTFVTDKRFSTIALKVHNPNREFNDSVYEVALLTDDGRLLHSEELEGKETEDYQFYPMPFENAAGVTHYELRIRKLSGENDLIFLYYDTGHYDVYPEGKLSGITVGDMADLIFEVYLREE